MELATFRRLFRSLFFIGAMIACFGLGLYEMDNVVAGIILLISGLALLIISFSITRFFAMVSIKHPEKLRNSNVKHEEKEE